MDKYILALDQGTSSSRAILYNQDTEILCKENKEFEQFFPQNAWVEHDPEEIWSSQLSVARKVLNSSADGLDALQAIGITNQRETSILWSRRTGKPIYNAIVWQDRRTAAYCEDLKRKGKQELVYQKTGLILDAYFSASKIAWMLDNIPGARTAADKGELAFGTVDSWLVWKLTKGESHITDLSNASRTMLYNIHDLCWDDDLLRLFNIPASILPQVVDSSGHLAMCHPEIFGKEIPISGIAGDQQAALFGQLCFEKGDVKCTYGTGCFLMLNSGEEVLYSKNKLLTTIAWKIGDSINYAIEGSVFIGGAVIQWLRDELMFFKEASDSEALAEAAEDNGGVYFVPALAGLGAPHWDPYARGSIFGITRSTSKAHLTRAALESICFQVEDLLAALEKDSEEDIHLLRADGGASGNNLLLQFQADISRLEVIRAVQIETTALGAAFLAGIGIGLWTKATLLEKAKNLDSFKPKMEDEKRVKLLKKWNKAIQRTKNWEDEED
jgi:glycerol kinase